MPPRPIDGPATSGERLASLPPSIGQYRLIDTIGWGGMGVVYRAEQERPRRTVAIKVLRHECADATRMRRMEQEAELLGRLQHPALAQVFDAGSWDAGLGAQPFLVMEYIEGVPLLEYVRTQMLDRDARIDLMIQICDAVQHAHDRGVIHRDLKPSNILVTEAGHPKVVDFGVAALVDETEGLKHSLTASGTLIGTTAYMSPEQARGDIERIGTTADVYALGVVLYEMLAGCLPFELGGLTLAGMVDVICTEEARPLGRGDPHLGGDLEVVLGKALEKDSSRRYSSPRALAQDLHCVLRHEPILARPPSWAYRLNRFIRRNRVPVLAVASVAAVLVLATAVSIVLAVQATQSEAAATRRLRQVRELATSIIVDLEDRIGNVQGATALHEFTVRTGLEYLAAIEAEHAGDAVLRRDVASAYRRIGDVQGHPRRGNLGRGEEAIASYSSGIDLLDDTVGEDRPILAGLLIHRGEVELSRGNIDAAAEDLTCSDNLISEQNLLLRADHAAFTARYHQAIGTRPDDLGGWREAVEIVGRVGGEPTPNHARLRQELGEALLHTGLATEAIAQLEKAATLWGQLEGVARWRQLARTEGGRTDLLRGQAMMALGRSEDAAVVFEAEARRARGSVWNDPSNEQIQLALGQVLAKLGQATAESAGRQDDAAEILGEAIAVLEGVSAGSDLVEAHRAMARARGHLVDVQRAAGRYEQALATLQEAQHDVEVQRRRHESRTLELIEAELQLTRAELMRHQRVDQPAALRMASEAAAVLADASAAEPGDGGLGRRASAGWLTVLRLQMALRQTEDAVESGRRATTLLREFHGRDPANIAIIRASAQAYRYLGAALASTGALDEGLVQIEQAITMLRAAVALDPMRDQLQRGLAATHYRLGTMLSGAERWAEARSAFGDAATIDGARLDLEPDNHLAVSDVVSDLNKVAKCHRGEGDMAAAAVVYQDAMDLAKASLARGPDAVERQRLVATTGMGLLVALRRSDQQDAATEVAAEMDRRVAHWLSARPDYVVFQQVRAAICIQQTELALERAGGADLDPQVAERVAAWLDEAEAILQAVIADGAGGPPEEAGLGSIRKLRLRAEGPLAAPDQ
ncbi:MAG: serine/threonine-protein kinase [Phycisphaerales bacterium]|jgi:tetratricopeptide (TPR) repeat protein/predicted Ser/Thr protein kinase|nr:serine/threonine-protein kinase [Phycisphaerales bacterium]